MKRLSLAVGILLLSLGSLAQTTQLRFSCRPYRTDPHQYGAFLNSFNLRVSPGVSATIYQARLGVGLIDLDHADKFRVVPMPASDSGVPTRVRKKLTSGAERFSRFHRIFSSEGFALTLDLSKPAAVTAVRLDWRSTDDLVVRETYQCEAR